MQTPHHGRRVALRECGDSTKLAEALQRAHRSLLAGVAAINTVATRICFHHCYRRSLFGMSTVDDFIGVPFENLCDAIEDDFPEFRGDIVRIGHGGSIAVSKDDEKVLQWMDNRENIPDCFDVERKENHCGVRYTMEMNENFMALGENLSHDKCTTYGLVFFMLFCMMNIVVVCAFR